MATGNVVIVGGTQGQGRELAQSYADDGRDVVVTGRDQARAEAAASGIGSPMKKRWVPDSACAITLKRASRNAAGCGAAWRR